jgi:hypothetical protein
MAFHDEIVRDIIAGRVPWRFKTRDLKTIPATKAGHYRVGNKEYSENTINTVPRNHSVSPDGTAPGDYVRKGREPAFFRYGEGEYELILHHQHCFKDACPEDEEFDVTEGDGEALIVGRLGGPSGPRLVRDVDEALVLGIVKSERPDPAVIIVRYIAEHPFQASYRRRPLGSKKHGWGERLAAYHWPLPHRDWRITCRTVTGLASQIQQAIRKLEARSDDPVASEELLAAFKATCVWGGVKLPEPDSSILAAEVLRGRQALLQKQRPPSSCRLNSAWTKLYALALPEQCVIYDSRVAAAVTSILDPTMNLAAGRPEWRSYRALGTIQGRGGSRPRDLRWAWPNGYKVWASQMAANLLCCAVRKEVNQQAMMRSDCRKLNDPSLWTLREVEAVLFMEGY